jgi:hypothetical protein
MKHKKIYFILLYLISLPGSANKLQISNIKIIGNTYTSERYIRYLLPFSPGDKLTLHDFNYLLRRAKEQLIDTGLFYDVQIFTIKKDLQYNIIIEIEEGFLYRFSGGAIYVSIGRKNIKGLGIRLHLPNPIFFNLKLDYGIGAYGKGIFFKIYNVF